MLDSNCLRCGVWFEGERCPICDHDTASKAVDPPPWFEGETFRSHAWGVRVPLYDEEVPNEEV
jgi:hypothetical protein